MKSPLDILLPYQRRWVDDAARFKIGLWARQTGKSFACAAEAVRHCHLNPRALWVILSAGERQALEFMRKARDWAQAFEAAIAFDGETRDGGKQTVLKAAEIVFKNGSRMVAVPANPDTARGYSGNVILDEFAFHEDPDAIWRAIYPSISNPLTGGKKLLRIVSTPNGKGNKFYDLWTKNEGYSRHKITIEDAVKRGLPLDIAELRKGLDDPDGWAQEYECEFIDASAVLLPYDLIAPCEAQEAPDRWPREAAAQAGDYYLGVDIGRKKDLSVFWLLRKEGDVLRTAAIKVFEKTPFAEQLDFLLAAMRSPHIRRACIDATGIGAMLAEEARRACGYRAEPCQFTAAFKEDIFLSLRRAFEDKRLQVPVSRAVREDLHGLQKITTSAGNIRILAPHNEDGHCDRATSLALALHAAAAGKGGGITAIRPGPHNYRSRRRV